MGYFLWLSMLLLMVDEFVRRQFVVVFGVFVE